MTEGQSLLESAALLVEEADSLAGLLEESHPLMAEAFCLAAIPEWYDVALLDALRLRDDGREAGLVERMARYSFIVPLPGSGEGHPTYAVRAVERAELQRRWIGKDPEAYRAAHARALAFWQEHPDPNPYAQAQNTLYHQLFVDFRAGIQLLLDRFRAYRNEHHLPAVERLLDTAREARAYLALLRHEEAATFEDLITYLAARLAQLRGDWAGAAAALEPLLARFDSLEPGLRPYLLRARAYDLARQGRYSQAIDCLKQALKEFNRPAVAGSPWGVIEPERGYTLIALGDAYVDLASAASGRGLRAPYRGTGDPRTRSFWARIQPSFNFLISLPLVLSLSFTLGGRVWHPRFWRALIGLDWIIARLMAKGARYYRQADDILERHGKAAEGLVADEKLASLHLRLGDAAAAERLCRWLLGQEGSPLGPYRQALVRVMLGDALLGLGRHDEARAPLRMALPVLDEYLDDARQARALELLGEALLATGQQAEALLHLAAASLRYQEAGRWTDATRLAEGLEDWLQGQPAPGPAGQKAADVVQGLARREYPGSYRHPVLLFFRQFILASLPFVLLVVPLLTIVLDTTSALSPEMHFRPVPILSLGEEDRPVLALAMQQGIKAANLSRAVISGTLLQMTAGFTLAYLLASLLLGLAAILFTPLQSVEARGRGATVYLDRDGLAVGRAGDEEGAPRARLAWRDLEHMVQADVRLWDRPLEDRSAFGVTGGGERLLVPGLTAWYAALRRRVAELKPEGSRTLDLDFEIFPSRLGWLYVANLVVVLLVGLVAASPDETLVLLDVPGTDYSAVDLYPYLFLGLVVAPLWWGVVQPIRQRVHLLPRTRLPLLMIGGGLLLLGLQILLRFRPLLTAVDLYLPLATAGVLLTGEWALWQARVGEERVHPAPLRLATAVVVLVACLFLGTVVVRDVRAYHALVQGNTLRDRAREAEEPEAHRALLDEATRAYGRAADLGRRPVWGLDTRPAARIHVGFPVARRFTWISALYSQGVLQTEAGLYPEAIATFSETLRYTPRNESAYASRALARLSLGTQVAGVGGVEVDTAQYRQAILDLRRASELSPEHASYHLWLGLAHHSYNQLSTVPGEESTGGGDLLAEAYYSYNRALELDERAGYQALKPERRERALTGLGWVAYARGQYEDARAAFYAATVANSESYEAWLALGYTLYALERFEDALPAWQRADALEPDSPTTLVCLGALHWRLGAVSGHDRCAEYRRSAGYFQRATAERDTWPLAAADEALTHRAAAQLQYLLGDCSGEDKVVAYTQAVSEYERVVALDPKGSYWWRKGRLSSAIADVLRESDAPRARAWLYQAIDDVGQAIQALPDEPIYLHDQAWMWYRAWAWSNKQGLAEQEGLLRARANLQAALALDADDRGTSYRPNFWLDIIDPLAVTGTLAMGDGRRNAGDAAGALAYYELVTRYAPDMPQAAFRAGLACLALGDGEGALAWYAGGLERAAAAGDEASPEEALTALYLALGGDRALLAAPVVGLFETRGIRPGVHDPLAGFELSVAALRAGDREEYARLAGLGLELAAAAGELKVVRQGAGLLRDYLIQHPEVNPAEVYWPLSEDLAARERAVAALPRPDLYWRYRAEFGFHLVGDRKLMLAREGSDRPYQRIMRSVAEDVERACALNAEEHQVWRDFYVDANIGWIYLRRGDDRAADDLARALADYELASLRIRPRSENAALDLAEALFKAGHAALRLGELERAGRLYDRVLDLLRRSGDEYDLARKVPDAIAALKALAAEVPALGPHVTPIVEALQEHR